MNIKLYAPIIISLLLNPYTSLHASELGADDIRGNLGNYAGVADQWLSGKDALGGKSVKEVMSEGFNDLIRQGNKDIAYLERQIVFYESSPEMVADFKNKIKYIDQNVLKKTVALKASLETFSFVGNAINVYEYNEAAKKFFSDAENNKIEYMTSVQPLLEKAVAFHPVAGGLLFIKDEVDKILDLSRGIGDEYSKSLTTILNQYNQQYHIIAERGTDGKSIDGFLDLYKSQRYGMRQQLDDLYNEANTLLPYFGKDALLAAIKSARFDLLGEQNEYDIRAKQVATYQHFMDLEKSREEASLRLKEFHDIKPIDTGVLSKIVAIDTAQQPNSLPSPSVQWATVTMQNQLSAITNGGASHIGSASLYTGYNNQQPNANVNPNNTNNYQTQTGSQQAAYSTNSQAFQSSDWVMVTGNAATHTGVGNSFGPITAPDGGQIASLNNSNMQYTVITKDFFVPVGVKQVTLTFNGNFVTNEYPTYVGSQYNDYASVKITSPSGNVTPVTAFNQSLNASNFTTVNGLPSPLSSTEGQTGFKASTATINVAGGGKVTVEVKVANVGDTAVPSAILLNKITVK